VLGCLQERPAASGDTSWTEHARKYLFQCVRLFHGDGERREHIQRLAALAQIGAPDSLSGRPGRRSRTADDDLTAWRAAIDQLDRDALTVAFQVLAKLPAEYGEPLQEYVYAKLEELFRYGANGRQGKSNKTSSVETAIGVLAGPVTLGPERFRRLVQFVRHRGRGPDSRADIHALARLREKIPEFAAGTVTAEDKAKFVAALTGLVARGRDETTDLAFILLECCGDDKRYFDAVITQLARAFAHEAWEASRDSHAPPATLTQQYLDLVKSSLEVAGLDGERGRVQFQTQALARLDELFSADAGLDRAEWLGELMLALFGEEESRRRCLQALTNVAGLLSVSRDLAGDLSEWRETLFQTARSQSPGTVVGDYFYLRLIPRAVRQVPPDSGTTVPKALTRLLERGRDRFAEDRLERLVRDMLRTVDAEADHPQPVEAYVSRAVWLSYLCPAEDRRRELVETLAGYRLAQPHTRYDALWVRTCFGLLLVPDDPALRPQRCRRMVEEIQHLHNEDSGHCPPARNEAVLRGNLKTVRTALKILAEMEQAGHSVAAVFGRAGTSDDPPAGGRELTAQEAALARAWRSRLGNRDSFHRFRDLTPERRNRAQAYFGIPASAPYVLGIQDGSLFGWARFGLLATVEGLYWRASDNGQPQFASYQDIDPDKVQHLDGWLARHLVLESGRAIRLRGIRRLETLEALTEFVRDAVRIVKVKEPDR
jgi:hypothetical protein